MKTPAAKIRFFLYFLLSLALIISLFQGILWVQSKRAGTIPITRVEAGNPLTIIYFHRHGCPHCAIANPVMAELENRYQKVNWLVAEVRPDMDPEAAMLYRTYLDQIGQKGSLTPLVAVGFNTDKIELFPGFGDVLNSREPIENAIRGRLGLNPVDLKVEAINFPVIGLQVLNDLPPQLVNKMLGFLGGCLPVSILIFWRILWAPQRRKLLFSGLISLWFLLFNLGLQILLHWIGGMRHLWLHTLFRWGLGLMLLVWGVGLLRNFFWLAGSDLSTQSQPAQPTSRSQAILVLSCLSLVICAEKMATAWLAEFGSRMLGSALSLETWLLFGSIGPGLACFAGILYLWLGEFNPKAKRVASLFCSLVILLLGCFLLSALGFRGYGPLWPWSTGP